MLGVFFLSRKHKSICSDFTQSAIFAVLAVWITALVFSKEVSTDACFNDAVGVADPGIITDNQFTASTHFNDFFHPYYGRLNGNRGDGWCSATCCGNQDWLQVDLGLTFQICGVATQGDISSTREWTEAFKVSYSTDGSAWATSLNTNGTEMEFQRSGDGDTVDQHTLPLPVFARYIRFRPTKQHGWNCLRVEVYGTAASTDACFNNAVGVADTGIIPDNQLTASTHFNDTYHPYYGRLNGNRGDSWCPATCCETQDWLQVDLGLTFQICGVATQGDISSIRGWTEAFKLSYSTDGNAWATSLNTNGTEMEFHRPGDSNIVGQHILPVSVSARYIRFRPTKQHNWNCLRVEVYGTVDSTVDNCRTVQFTPQTKDRVLENHVIRRMQVPNKDKCELDCFLEPNCVSYNYGPTESEESFCELNDRTHFQVPNGYLSSKQGYIYRHIVNLCQSNPCLNSATCQAGFTTKGYRCICPPSHRGDHCETDVDECAENTDNCHSDAICTNTDGHFQCECQAGFMGNGITCTSCVLGTGSLSGSCYALVTQPQTGENAETECQTMGGHLVKIDSSTENDFIKNTFLTSHGSVYWIGLTRDQANAGTWIWTADGSTNGYTNWGSAQPNNYLGIQDCVVIAMANESFNLGNGYALNNYNAHLNDLECHLQFGFICEKAA